MVINGGAHIQSSVAPLIVKPLVASMFAPITPNIIPMIPPMILITMPSLSIRDITCSSVNPRAFNTPISLVRSITDVIIVAAIPTAATAKANSDVANVMKLIVAVIDNNTRAISTNDITSAISRVYEGKGIECHYEGKYIIYGEKESTLYKIITLNCLVL